LPMMPLCRHLPGSRPQALYGSGTSFPLWLRQVSDTLGRGSGSGATVAPVAVLHPVRTSAHAEARHP